MKRLFKYSKGAIVGFSFFSLGLAPAYADDTEIYFGGDFIGTNVATRPNILFVLDTSGSMGFSLEGHNNGSNERLNALKESMTSLLSSMSNVNAGIMRFTNPGGPVLHEIAYIDEISGSGEVTVTSQVSNSQSDATELLLGGDVSLNAPLLEFSETLTGLTTVSSGANSGANMATEAISSNRNGWVWDSSCPQLIDRYYSCDSTGGGFYETLLGLRFQGLSIPNSAIISSAVVDFGIDDQQGGGSGENSDDLSVDIRAEMIDSGPFVTGYTNNISSRGLSSSAINWDINSNPAQGSVISTDDISTLVQPLVSEPAWNTSSVVTLVFSEAAGSEGGRREIERHSDTLKPTLRVSYAASEDPQRVGIRFTGVGVPSGATITNAYIDFTAASSNADAATYTISGESIGDSPEFQAVTSNIGSRTRTSSQITWSNVEAWDGGSVYSSPDLTAIVQEVVGHADWCGGNAMSFIVEGSNTGRRVAESYDNAPGSAPRLVVEYDALTIPESGGCMAAERGYQVGANSDDAEQSNTTGATTTGGNQLNLRSDRKFVGVRFNGLAIPKDAEITSAYMEFRAAESDSGSLTVEIAAQDADNATTFDGSSSDLSNRALTSNKATWSPGSWSQNQFYQTSDISDVVEELVGRAGWSAGNSAVFIIKYLSGSGGRDAVSRNSQAANAPRIIINYKTDDYEASLVTVRDDLQAVVDNEIIASGSTPIVETYHEAALYMRGDAVRYGKNRSSSNDRKHNTRVSTPTSWTGGTVVRAPGCTDANLNADACKTEYISGNPIYTSPMEYSCQENHIVFLTDGEPTSGNDSISSIQSLIGSNCANVNGDDDYKCGAELAKFLFEEDQDEGLGSLAGKQSIKTHTIALIGGQSSWLESIATNGGGDYYPISGNSVPEVVEDLTAAFNSIVGDVMDVDTSFVAPAVAINQFNRLTHRSEIYYAVFKPQESPEWPGNLKKYKLSGSDVQIVDASNTPAIDKDTGGFKATSKSVWSDLTDGNDVTLGGAANELPDPNDRNIYLYHGGSTSKTLTNSKNLLVSTNAEITNDMLGITGASVEEREKLINWIRGMDVKDDDLDTDTTEKRNIIGDPLHSRPLVVTYDVDPNDDGDDSDAKYYLFFGTNGGLIHAVDGRDGKEKYAIATEELMPNFKVFYDNQDGVTRPYGIDGESTVWIRDVDKDGKIEAGDGDHVYLYIGMRRGGRSYYAYDITSISAPKFMWKVEGGNGDFNELGQTWSKPLLTRVKYKSGGTTVSKQVLFFGGGYDDNQDDVSVTTPDAMGRALYMVDAETGDLLWSAGKDFTGNAEDVDDMLYGIPSRLAGADINADGYLDMLIYGDMGGQVFRTDFDNSGTADLSGFSSTKRIADISKDGVEADSRRFYHGADIALTRIKGEKYLTILIGSGYRAHPLDANIEDRFYAFKQTISGASTNVDVTEDDLYDATDNDVQDGSTSEQAVAKAAITSAKGWYVKMENQGEKVLSRPLVMSGAVIFTTYEPKASLVGCTPVPGQSREYIMSVLDASAVVDKDDIDGLSKSDRSSLLSLQGIVDDTVLVVTDEGQGGFQGTQDSDAPDVYDGTVRTFWYQDNN